VNTKTLIAILTIVSGAIVAILTALGEAGSGIPVVPGA